MNRLLIVDDNPADRQLVADMLDGASAAYAITEAESLAEARRQLEHGFDVVLLDMVLPDGCGAELIPVLCGMPEPPAVVMLSGLAHEREAIDAVRAGAYDYLCKDDVGPELLMRSLRAAVEHAGSRRQIAIERRALARSEARFRAFAQSIPEPSWSSDASGHPQMVNTKWEEHFGPMRAWTELVEASERAPVEQAWRRALAERCPLELRVPMVCRRGVRWHLVRAQPAGAPIADWYATFSDVQELEAARTQLERIARGKDDFMAVLGHELRTPLGTLRLAIDGISEDRSLCDAMLPRASRQLAVMERICDDLLEASRCLQGKISLMLAPIDLTAVVEDAVTGAQPRFDARGIRLHQQLEEGIEVSADAVRLTQVVNNLLVNAAKYGRAEGNAWVRLERTGSGVCLRVSDDGPGIDPDLLPVLFEPFTQAAHEPGEAKGGVGLGLSIAHRLVALHGGSIQAAAREGGGTVMTVELPRAPADRSTSTSGVP